MAKNAEAKQKPIQRLFEYAGNFKYLTIASWVLAVISAFAALVPFYFIWCLIKEVLRVAPDYGAAQNLAFYGWSAVGTAVLAMLIYIGALICSHLSAFRVQANMRSQLMRHILSLPLGFMEEEGSGKIRKIVNESSAATETYIAHQLPDKCVAFATPAGLAILLLIFDWRLGLLCLIPVVAAFAVMSTMMGENMKKKMEEYQNALEEMSSEAVEYVRGISVVKTFGQSVFSFKRFQTSIKKYEKWTIAYTKDLMWPMVGFTTLINAIFAILIGAAYWFGGANGDPEILINLLFYIIITPVLTVTLGKIMYGGENQMIVEDALKRTDGILNRKPLPEATTKQEIPEYSVALQNVSFRYENAERDALHQINLDIKEGETSPPKRYNSGSMILAMENAGQLIEDEDLRSQIKGSGIGTSATRAEILKKLFNIRYLSLNKKTQVITPTLQGEMIYDVVNCSIRQLLNPELTASWEKGLTYVAEGSITEQEYMDKLEHFVRIRTKQVEDSHFQYALRQFFDAAAQYYKKPERETAVKKGRTRSDTDLGIKEIVH